MISLLMGSAAPTISSMGFHQEYVSATGTIEKYHKGLSACTADEITFARAALADRPEEAGYIQSELFPVRCHYETIEYEPMARQILGIVEESWQEQVLGMGFAAPPPDCGYGGSDDLDVYIRTLPQGVGGYAAFACYIESTPEADAASFIAISDSLGEAFLRSAVTHEFNHVLQNGMDYWENITFKEMTATWVMDWMYDDDNQYFGYLRSYQKNPDWPMHKFSTSSTYQYGASIFLHFLSEYYGGGSPEVIVDLWRSCIQNEYRNEPDFQDVLVEAIPRLSGGMDTLSDMMTEYAAWRTITASRDDGVHFHDGGLWPAGAEIEPDSTVDLTDGLPVSVSPVKAPYDFGFCFIRAVNPEDFSGSLAIEFSGDPEVDWAVVLVHRLAGSEAHMVQPMAIDGGWGIGLLNRGLLARSADITIGIVNLSNAAFDPDDGTDGVRRSFEVTFSNASPDTRINLWTDQPMTGPGMPYGLNLEFEYHDSPGPVQFWLFAEILGTLFPVFTDAAGAPAPVSFTAVPGMSFPVPLFGFILPAIPDSIPVRWHAGLTAGGALLDYNTVWSNCVSEYQ